MDFINIIGTFFDNSIEHVIALAHQIKDLRLNKNQQDINEDIYNEISSSKKINQQLTNKITFIEEDLESVHQEFQEAQQNIDSKFEEIDGEFENVYSNLDRLSDVSSQGIHEITENIDSINEHIENIDRDNEDLNRRVTYIEENGLPEFNNDKLKHKLVSKQEYDALEAYERNTLYIIVDFNENTSVFGDTFPLILGGDVADASHFGDNFPLILGDSSYYIGSKFPITFKQ